MLKPNVTGEEARLVSDVAVLDNISEHGDEAVRQMRFALFFYNFPNFAAVIIECRIDSEQVCVITQNFISGYNRREAIDFPGSYQ